MSRALLKKEAAVILVVDLNPTPSQSNRTTKMIG
jgi:hypothetical protein